MRRLLSVLIAGALLAGSACTPLSGAGAKTLEVLVGADAARAGLQQEWFADMARKFEERTGYEVRFRTFASSEDEQKQIQSAVITGRGPDVFALGTTFTPVAYATGAFHELTEEDWAKLGGKDRFVPQQLTMSGPDEDRQIGVPLRARPFGMVYNTELFERAGIEEPPRTWTEFVEAARKTTDPERGVYGVANGPSDALNPWKFIWTSTLQSGGELISADNRTAKLDSPEVLDAAAFWLDWTTRYRIADPRSVTWKSPDAMEAFANGKAAMLPMTTSQAVPQLTKSKVADHYAVAPLPTVPYGMTERPAGAPAAGTIVSGDNIAIAEYSQKKEAALEFIAMLTSDEEQLAFWKTFGDQPTTKNALAKASASDARTKAFADAQAGAAPTNFTGAWGTLQIALGTVVSQTLPSVAQGSYDRRVLADRLAQVNTQVQAALDQQAKAEAKAVDP